jgi:K+-sensing histidine kinase KdpD
VDIPLLEREWQVAARTRLQELIDEEGLGGAGVATAVLDGTPHVAILHYAKEQQVDLIVIGTHGHGPIRRFLLGSVAERVVRATRCPVLTVPSQHAFQESSGGEPSPRCQADAASEETRGVAAHRTRDQDRASLQRGRPSAARNRLLRVD